MEDFIQKIVAEYNPRTEEQRFVAEQIALAMFRIRRCQELEDKLMLEADPFEGGKLDKLERYRQSIERSYQRFTKRWAEIRKEIIREEKAVTRRNENEFYEILRHEREVEREVLASLHRPPLAESA